MIILLALRLSVRSSLAMRTNTQHEHEYGDEESEEEEDMYSKTCKSCSHKMTYEKM